ncbi:MAG: plasmid pRiA4b ORF-3 family protein [Chloroflexota bacterium]
MTDKTIPQTQMVPGYQIRARILDVYPIIWRRFLLRADNTFADLHYALQIALDWSDDFLHHFKLRGKTISVPRMFNEYTHSATKLTLADFNFKEGQRFLYEYNFYVFWQIEIRIEKLCSVPVNSFYPKCIDGKRAGPIEDCGGPSGFMQLRDHHLVYANQWMLDLCHLLLEADEMTEELREEIDAKRNEYHQLKYWINIERFKRRPINQRLKLYADGNDEWHHTVEVG